jgi:hypothetical protein
MPEKPTKWWIQARGIVDSNNGYLLKCTVYVKKKKWKSFTGRESSSRCDMHEVQWKISPYTVQQLLLIYKIDEDVLQKINICL